MKKDSKTKDFPILFKKNYKNWFRCIKVKIKGKEAYYSIESNKTEYIWIYKKRETTGNNREKKTTIPTNINISRIDNLISKFKRIKGS